MIASTSLLWADYGYMNIDSITTSQRELVNAISTQVSGDTIKTNSIIDGSLNLCTCDSVNVVLSGTPSVKIEDAKMTDWGVWTSLLAIIVNAIVVYFTFINEKKLQKHETGEIRTRKIQEIAITQQVAMYEKMVELSKMSREIGDKSDSSSAKGLLILSQNSSFKQRVAQAQDFLASNELYIRGELKKKATEVLEIFGSEDFKYDIITKMKLEDLLKQYSDIYNDLPIGTNDQS